MSRLLVIAITAAAATVAMADSVDLSFSRITSNANENVEAQFGLTIQEVGGDTSVVDFIFTNAVGIASSISEIYLDDGQPTGVRLLSGAILSQVGTDFEWGSASPGDLPGGQGLADPFLTSFALLGDAQGNPNKGINRNTDSLTVRFTYTTGTGFSDLETALGNGDLRVGFHVRSIGADEESDGFVNNPPEPIPLPTTSALALAGLGVIGSRRRR